jgi:hypothetical protein
LQGHQNPVGLFLGLLQVRGQRFRIPPLQELPGQAENGNPLRNLWRDRGFSPEKLTVPAAQNIWV